MALEDCTLLSLSAEDVAVVGLEIDQLRVHVIVQYLERISFFKDVKPTQRMAIASIVEVELYGSHEEVYSEGSDSDEMYILVEGRVILNRRRLGAL